MIAPLVAVILAFALYPQLALDRSESSVKASIGRETSPRRRVR